jgi:hypothetical protein
VPDVWHHIEVEADLNASGSSAVYVDGILAVSATSDFTDTGQTYASLSFYGDDGTNTVDDIVVQTDASTQPTKLGVHKIHTLLPDGDTAQADWTGSVTDVDDPIGSADNGTSVITTSTLNHKSEFDLASLPVTPTVIHAVQTVVVASKSAAGVIGLKQHVDSNGIEDASAEFSAPLDTYRINTNIHPLNPDGSVAWTETTVNAVKVGVALTNKG